MVRLLTENEIERSIGRREALRVPYPELINEPTFLRMREILFHDARRQDIRTVRAKVESIRAVPAVPDGYPCCPGITAEQRQDKTRHTPVTPRVYAARRDVTTREIRSHHGSLVLAFSVIAHIVPLRSHSIPLDTLLYSFMTLPPAMRYNLRFFYLFETNKFYKNFASISYVSLGLCR